MRLPDEPDRPPQINIVPMIDVIFAILVYFIVSSLFLTRSEGLPVNLPQAETVELQRSAQITVSLDSEGILTVGDDVTKLDRLKAKVENLMETEQTKVVVINADKVVDHGQVVDVLDRLRQIPEASLAIAARKNE
ncbi:Biopolymer transport protein ExbD/TolR [Hyella patelloides LEGE 07179]|uniref:Biopolymer transport protein ExbD/TolR n=1 Tax=Hyella patelloides LEGE 07179 TaxID=945734 RepID=A0A563W3G9_9CYAN|nr:biopolymer transporter ExbD [Hyella patelloides]VEP18187.1 Biopolymer transport protein ExbD/TolR [Hyella patelloides LEGE 07179]